MGKIAPEVAEKEFARFAEAWRLDLAEDGLDDEDRESLKQQRRRVILAIEMGNLAVEEDARTLTYSLVEPIGEGEPIETLTINIPRGDAMLAFDRHKQGRDVAKLNGFMGAMTGINPTFFGSRMSMIDLKPLQAIATLFLGS